MTKFIFDNLCFEVTRRCNMRCAHCLRGEAEDCDMPGHIINNVLLATDSIGSVTFTGGEPSLAVKKIAIVRELCEKRHIPVYGFFVATNGKEVSAEFMAEMLRWYAYVLSCGGDADMCSLALSKDEYHEKIPEQNERLLRGFSFFSDCKFNKYDSGALLDLGNARNIVSHPKHDPFRFGLDAEIIDEGSIAINSTVTVACDGGILSDCDYEYDDTDSIRVAEASDMESLAEYVKEWCNE